MAEGFSLKDHLFNAETMAQLAAEYAAGVPGFDAEGFQKAALSGFAERGLLARLDWIADCIEAQLADDFPTMAGQLEAALPAPLDPTRSDDDFGRFIHAVPGVLAVRHGLAHHRARALDLLHAATQRFSMEFYIRPFLNRWPEHTLTQLEIWAADPNYHVRRLVSEGTRPKLPWAKAVRLTPDQTLPLLDRLHADDTRYVTRSVANHLNDLTKTVPDHVLSRLAEWKSVSRQNDKELAWMTRHALRTLIKQGHPGTMTALGYARDLPVVARIDLARDRVRIGDHLVFDATLTARTDAPVLVDYRIVFARSDGKTTRKVFKLKTVRLRAGKALQLTKRHHMKGDATTFRLHAGVHRLILQVNGRDVAETAFELV